MKCFLILVTLLLAGCNDRGEEKSQEEDSSRDALSAGRVLIPNLKERIHYRTTIRYQPPVQRVELPQGTKVSEKKSEDGRFEESYDEVHKYVGERELMPGLMVHAYEVMIGGEVVSRNFVTIKESQLYSIATQQIFPEKKEPALNFAPILIMDVSVANGKNWLIEKKLENGKKVPFHIFYVINRETVETKAGSYKCIHIRTQGYGSNYTTRSNIWFAPRVGVIKEKTHRFTVEGRASVEERVLIKHEKN